MTLIGFQYEPVTLDLSEVCFVKEKGIPNTRE